MAGTGHTPSRHGAGRGGLSLDRLVTALLFTAAGVSVLCVAAIFGFLAYFCLPLLSGDQLGAVLSWHWRPTSGQFGILPMVVGSLLLSSSAMLLAYPLGLGLCCFVHGLGPARPSVDLGRPLMAVIRLMTSVPTVVYGLVSVFLLVPLIRSGFSGSGFSWLAALLVLAVLVLPTIVLVLDSQLRLVGPPLRLTAAALGLTRAQELLHLTLPLSARGLKAAAVLGFGRAVGDTLIPLMLAGNAAQVPHSPLDALRALTAHIALVVATDSQSAAYTSLFACGVVLFLITLAVNLGLRRIRSESTRPEGNWPKSSWPGGGQAGRRACAGAAMSRPGLRLAERALPPLAWAAALSVPAAFFGLMAYLLWRGLPSLSLALFFGATPPLAALLHGAPVFEGLWPACQGTLYLVLVSCCLAVPRASSRIETLAHPISRRSATAPNNRNRERPRWST